MVYLKIDKIVWKYEYELSMINFDFWTETTSTYLSLYGIQFGRCLSFKMHVLTDIKVRYDY